MRELHVDDRGHARMVDVGEKPVQRRTATARADIAMGDDAMQALARGALAKGDALAVARIAASQQASNNGQRRSQPARIRRGSIGSHYNNGLNHGSRFTHHASRISIPSSSSRVLPLVSGMNSSTKTSAAAAMSP